MIQTKNLIYFIFALGFITLISSSIYLDDKYVKSYPKEVVANSKEIKKIETKPLESKSALIIGIDKSGKLTDVMMIAYLDINKNEVKLISIPRDLLIDFREEPFKMIKKRNSNIMAKKVRNIAYCKLNEVYASLGRDEEAMCDLKEIISLLAGIKIDYLTTINIKGFKNIVDAVDGVDFDVPRDMDYEAEDQGLYIHLKKGYQHLDGNKAEQLVRYRKGYARQDLDRNDVQREFISVLINKIVQIKDWNKIMNIMNTIYNYVKTDIKFMDVLDYSKHILDSNTNRLLKPENQISIIPDNTQNIRINKKSFLKWGLTELNERVNEFLFSIEQEEASNKINSVDVFGHPIDKNGLYIEDEVIDEDKKEAALLE